MLRNFKIMNDSIKTDGEHAILTYDEETEKYSIHIPQEVPCNDLPAILSLLAKQRKIALTVIIFYITIIATDMFR